MKDLISSKFDIEDLGQIKQFLGIEVTKDRSGFFSLNQSKYIKKVINDFRLSDAKASNVPMLANYGKEVAQGDSGSLTTNKQYQQPIGCLLYIVFQF